MAMSEPSFVAHQRRSSDVHNARSGSLANGRSKRGADSPCMLANKSKTDFKSLSILLLSVVTLGIGYLEANPHGLYNKAEM